MPTVSPPSALLYMAEQNLVARSSLSFPRRSIDYLCMHRFLEYIYLL